MLSAGIRLNPYPPDYRTAFACSTFLYPLRHRSALRHSYPVCLASFQRERSGLTVFSVRHRRG
jgi:hypothetical protein